MFNKNKKQPDSLELPENNHINEQIPQQEEIVEVVQKEENLTEPTLKDFVSIVSAELLDNGLIRYTMVSDKEFKLGLQTE